MALIKKYWIILLLLIWVLVWFALADRGDASGSEDADAALEVPPEAVESAESSAPTESGVSDDLSGSTTESAPAAVDESTQDTMAEGETQRPDASVAAAAAEPEPRATTGSEGSAAAAMPESQPEQTTRSEDGNAAESSVPAMLADTRAAEARPSPMPIEAGSRRERSIGSRSGAPGAGATRSVDVVIHEARWAFHDEGIAASVDMLEQALARPDFDDIGRARLLAELGDAYFAAGDMEHAKTAYRSSILQLPPRERAMMERRYRMQGRL